MEQILNYSELPEITQDELQDAAITDVGYGKVFMETEAMYQGQYCRFLIDSPLREETEGAILYASQNLENAVVKIVAIEQVLSA